MLGQEVWFFLGGVLVGSVVVIANALLAQHLAFKGWLREQREIEAQTVAMRYEQNKRIEKAMCKALGDDWRDKYDN